MGLGLRQVHHVLLQLHFLAHGAAADGDWYLRHHGQVVQWRGIQT